MSGDPEKHPVPAQSPVEDHASPSPGSHAPNPVPAGEEEPPMAVSAWQSFKRRLIKTNDHVESRGLQRVPLSARRCPNKPFLGITTFWFSANLAANNLTLGMLGPAVFSLSFLDASLCAVFGGLLGSLGAAYIGSFGPRSGLRGMVFARFTLGSGIVPGRLAVLLTCVNLLGYAVINGVIAGQILSAIGAEGQGGAGGVSIVVGIVLTALVTWAVSTFGHEAFQAWERYAWVPALMAYCILAGVAGPMFSLSPAAAAAAAAPSAETSTTNLAGNRLSFFSLCFSAAITYSSNSADYFVYLPPTTSRRKFVLATMSGLVPSFTMMFVLGIGLTSSAASLDIYGSSSAGGLLRTSLTPLGTFGDFIAAVIALGLISNLIPTTYSAGINLQLLFSPLHTSIKDGVRVIPLLIPRVVANTLAVIIWMICAIAGRERLADIFTNFLAVVGYWFSFWVGVVVLEEGFFVPASTRRRRGNKHREKGHVEGEEEGEGNGDGWDWDIWDQSGKLPLGIAGLLAIGIGYVGAVLCMTQVWFVGPLARAAFGPGGGDLGIWVGLGLTALIYIPVRWWEVKIFNR